MRKSPVPPMHNLQPFTFGRTPTTLAHPYIPLFTTLTLYCSNLCAIHAKRVTIQVKDIQLARRIRGLADITG